MKYYNERAMVLKGTDYDEIFFLLMFKRYDLIAKKWVHVGPQEEKPSVEDVEKMLRVKTKRFTPAEIEAMYPQTKKTK
jgi:hypothetical protein